MGHAILVHPLAPVVAGIAARERLVLDGSGQSLALGGPSSLRRQVWTNDAKTCRSRTFGPTPATTFGLCCALKGEASAGAGAGADKRKEGGKRKIKGDRPDLIEEDIYTVNDGWKIEFAATEEMMEVAGVQIPVRLKQQLQKERRVKPVVNRAPAEPPRATHKLLRVMAGRCAGKKLISPADANVRPMMEVVRGAVFSILKSLGTGTGNSPPGRWLDLYSGTGSVAIEALSRRCCAEAHFVEIDPWVISNVLRPNLESTDFLSQSVVHTAKVETLLQQASQFGGQLLGGPFDYISVTPPYEAVSYTELMGQLADSPLLSETTFVVVEYPLQSRHEMPESCGALAKIKDRKYGRTYVAIYGPRWLERDD